MTVSIIIPTYNRRHMIGRAIDSVLGQQGVDAIEIIVVDDGSTDGTADLIRREYQAYLVPDRPHLSPSSKSDALSLSKSATAYQPRLREGEHNLQPSTFNLPPSTCLRLIHQANSGAPVARNAGIRAARGEFVALLDSDDELTPDSLAIRVRALSENPEVDLVCGNFVNCVDGQPAGPPDYERLDVPAITKHRQGAAGAVVIEDFFDVHLRRPIALTSGLCLRRTAIGNHEFFDESLVIGQDWEFCLRFSRNHRVAVTLPVAARRHVHGANLVKVKRGGDGMIRTDRTVLAYPGLTPEQRSFAQDRLADDLYEYAYNARRNGKTRRPALKALVESLRMRVTWPKLKLLAAYCLPDVARAKQAAGVCR